MGTTGRPPKRPSFLPSWLSGLLGSRAGFPRARLALHPVARALRKGRADREASQESAGQTELASAQHGAPAGGPSGDMVGIAVVDRDGSVGLAARPATHGVGRHGGGHRCGVDHGGVWAGGRVGRGLFFRLEMKARVGDAETMGPSRLLSLLLGLVVPGPSCHALVEVERWLMRQSPTRQARAARQCRRHVRAPV